MWRRADLQQRDPPLPRSVLLPPVEADGGLAQSSNPNCQTGCNGGAASICNSGVDGGAAACALACENDQADLSNPSAQCPSPDGGTDASSEASSEASSDAGGDAAKETGGDSGHEASTSDGGAD